jgi:hypothetical protein
VLWSDNTNLLDYNTQLGRSLLRHQYLKENLATKKWNMILPTKFQFVWSDTWDMVRARKEAMLIWQMWHKAVAVNAWRGRISPQIDQSYPLCPSPKKETVLYRFWSCDTSQQLWTYSNVLLNLLAHSHDQQSWSPAN